MKRVCPVCRQSPQDQMLVKCDRCKVPFVDETSLELSLSQDDLKQVVQHILKSWRFWIPLAVGVFAAVWAVLQTVDYITGRRVQNVFDDIHTNVSNSLVKANSVMTNEIARRFQEPNIRELMEQVASAESRNIISNRVTPIVEGFRVETRQYLAEIKDTKDRVVSLEKDIKSVTELAKPPTLTLNAAQVDKKDKGLEVLLQFRPSKDVGLGSLDFIVKIVNDCATIIISGEPSVNHHPYTGGPAQISQDGKQASFNFAIIGAGNPTLKLTLSGEALLQITGSKLGKPAVYTVTEKKPNN